MLNLSAADVLTVGIDLEQRAAEFYAQAAIQTDDPDSKALLARLHGMEIAHTQRLQSWCERLSPQDRTTGTERIAEAQLILSTLALGPFLRLKIDPHTRLTGTESAAKILQIAIGFEENAISLLSALINLMPPDIGREQVEAMRAEEYKHRQLLTEQLVVCQLRTKVRAAAKQSGRFSSLIPGADPE